MVSGRQTDTTIPGLRPSLSSALIDSDLLSFSRMHSSRVLKASTGRNMTSFGGYGTPHSTHAHSADAVPTDVRSSTTTSEALRASCFIVSPPEDPPLPAILAGLSRSPATSSLAERIASRAGAPAATISGALCFGGEGPGRWLIAAAAERGGDHQCQERLHAKLPGDDWRLHTCSSETALRAFAELSDDARNEAHARTGRLSAVHAACWTARHGVGATPNPRGARRALSSMNIARHSPSAMWLSDSRIPCRFDAHGDEPDAGPGVEPAVEKLQLGLSGREPEEAEGGTEAAGRWGQFHQPSRAICRRISRARRSSGFTSGHLS